MRSLRTAALFVIGAGLVFATSACANVWGFSDLSTGTGSDGGAQGNPPGSDGGQNNNGFADSSPPPYSVELGAGPFGLVDFGLYESSGSFSTTAEVYFAAMGFPCAQTVAASCVLFVCPSGVGLPPMRLSAGTITVSGGTFPFMITADSSGGYGYAPNHSALWNGGETLTVIAAGADVPAFTTSLQPPTQQIIVTAPQPSSYTDAGTPVVDVSRLSDLVVQWNGDMSGQVAIALGGFAAGDGGEIHAVVECLFDGPPGVGTVPSSLLQQMLPGPGASLLLFPSAESIVHAGSYAVLVELDGTAQYPGGAPSGLMNVTLQ